MLCEIILAAYLYNIPYTDVLTFQEIQENKELIEKIEKLPKPLSYSKKRLVFERNSKKCKNL